MLVFPYIATALAFFGCHDRPGPAATPSAAAGDQAAVGEATPGYISHPDASQRIRDTLSDAKLVASLRHPVDRAYSAFWHHMRAGQLDPGADFVTLFRQDGQFGLRSRGYYFTQLSRYQKYFACGNLLVLIYEEISNDNREAIGNCLKFLEVDTQFEPSALDSRVNRGGRDLSAFHFAAAARRRLVRGRHFLTLIGGEPALTIATLRHRPASAASQSDHDCRG